MRFAVQTFQVDARTIATASQSQSEEHVSGVITREPFKCRTNTATWRSTCCRKAIHHLPTFPGTGRHTMVAFAVSRRPARVDADRQSIGEISRLGISGCKAHTKIAAEIFSDLLVDSSSRVQSVEVWSKCGMTFRQMMCERLYARITLDSAIC